MKNKGEIMAGTLKENKMGTMRISRLLFSVSIPIIISMLVQALYNIVDTMFVAKLDSLHGTGALTLAFPMQNLLLAVSIGMAVGINALLSRSLGQKNFEKANKIAGQGFFLMACGYLLFLITGIFLTKFYVDFQINLMQVDPKIDVDKLRLFTNQYVSMVTICSFGVFVQVLSERLLQATGKTVLSMSIQLSGAIINIILDPILIFGVPALGIPKMEVFGAALATVIGQVIAAVVGIILNLVFNKEIKIKIKNFIPDGKLIGEILGISIPSIFMQAIGTVMTMSMNLILGSKFTMAAVNVFGIYFKLQSFVFMPVIGLNSGMIPILSYNYGAGKPKRVFKTMGIAYIAAVAYVLIGLLAFQLFPELLLSIFDSKENPLDQNMINIGITALQTISWSFLFAGFSIISIASCQALGKSIFSLFVSIGRQLVVLIPAAFLLSLLGDVKYVWWAFPIAELASLLLCGMFLIITLRSAFGKKKDIITEEKIHE